MLAQVKARKVPFYFLEAAMCVVLLVIFGLTFPNAPDGGFSPREFDLSRHFTFILNGVLAGVAMLSSIVQYPFTLQYIRSMLPYGAWRHPMLMPIAHTTAWIWATSFAASALFYLIPYTGDAEMHIRGQYDTRAGDPSGDNLFAVVFRIVLPIGLYVFCALITRLLPSRAIRHIDASAAFDSAAGGARGARPGVAGGVMYPGFKMTENPLSAPSWQLSPMLAGTAYMGAAGAPLSPTATATPPEGKYRGTTLAYVTPEGSVAMPGVRTNTPPLSMSSSIAHGGGSTGMGVAGTPPAPRRAELSSTGGTVTGSGTDAALFLTSGVGQGSPPLKPEDPSAPQGRDSAYSTQEYVETRSPGGIGGGYGAEASGAETPSRSGAGGEVQRTRLSSTRHPDLQHTWLSEFDNAEAGSSGRGGTNSAHATPQRAQPAAAARSPGGGGGLGTPGSALPVGSNGFGTAAVTAAKDPQRTPKGPPPSALKSTAPAASVAAMGSPAHAAAPPRRKTRMTDENFRIASHPGTGAIP
jgi:hypothetical protein